MTKFPVIASNDSSGKGSRSTYDSTNSSSGRGLRASSTIVGEMSPPTTVAPRSAAAAALARPVAMSSSRVPAPAPTASKAARRVVIDWKKS